ncbi:hypothetical protein L3Q82_005528 [Scortum barcoo]|uniref:Uncharacterized protein n=1 Tax=Scortum barcoo TaxID=214431 RepID=A0ACB8VAB6_9TELE|nr:hypothetical protein L3Q82_005528 [Scortum barcoo]
MSPGTRNRSRDSKRSAELERRRGSCRLDHGGEQRLKPGLRKYACELTLDTNTAHRDLKLSEDNRKVTFVSEEQPYPDHPERFDVWEQLLCRTGLTGRCYWEVEWRGGVYISVSYRGIRRKGTSDDCKFGGNNQSWSLRVAVYVDCPAGTLSFYRVSSDTLIHLHTFNTTFTEPLYPGFGFWQVDMLVRFRPVYSVLMLLGVGSAMNQCEETEEGVPPSKTTLCGEHDGQTKAQRPEQQRPDSPEPEPSCVSIKSPRSMERPLVFKGRLPPETHDHQQRPDSPVPSCVSMKSDWSMIEPLKFSDGHHSAKEKVQEVTGGQSVQQQQIKLDSVFKHLEENIVTFVKNELKKFQKVLSPDYPECLERLSEDEMVDGEDEEQRKSSREAFLKITLHFLRRMNQEELADCLQIRAVATVYRHQLKSNLKKKLQCVFEGIAKAGNPTLLNQIYTELYITEGGTAEVSDEHEPHPGRDEPIRTVMTKGVAGIGKTVLTQKFTLDWAEDKANQDIHFTFPFTFRELNVLKEKKFSLVELVHQFFTETKEAGICRFEEFQVVFIFDGLDECRLPLDFHNNEILTDVTESTSVDVLLTNLIRGKLLPSARLWITTRPAAANQIPPECVDMVTEVRGFTDPQKEEYFRKRFRDEEQASRIISHIKTSQSLHIMCHIPVFCWITATVLEDVLKTREGGELPKKLTEMYIHFLVVQAKVKNIKYDGGAETDPHWNKKSRKMIASLGKLAFEQLQKGNLIFYESDLTECGIDIRAASVYSGVFTQIFKEERGLYQDKVFCFIHLSVQEFLAALHVHLTFINSGVILLSEKQPTSLWSELFRDKPDPADFYQSSVDKALQSPNGHLDLFLRFLLGLSLETNQTLLRGLVTHTGSISQTNQKIVEYIKKKISENLSPERNINLFHCLNELNDRSLVEGDPTLPEFRKSLHR